MARRKQESILQPGSRRTGVNRYHAGLLPNDAIDGTKRELALGAGRLGVQQITPHLTTARFRRVWRQQAAMRALTLLLGAITGCEPNMDLGDWRCATAPLFIPPDGSPEPAGKDTVVNLGWHSGFEDGFCGYSKAHGFCYSAPDATYHIVDDPAHSGRKAAKFAIHTDDSRDGEQARCVREGMLPKDAYYGAWFYIPRGTTNNDNWNLMHFRSPSDDSPLEGDWDVSVVNTDDGKLAPWLRDYVGGSMIPPSSDVEVPVDEWFALTLHLRRESTATGIAALYLNDRLVVERTNTVTDDDSTWGQWYVGNLATNLSPSESTIYVDDVSIRETLDIQP